MHHIGNLDATEQKVDYVSALMSVEGSLSIYAKNPALTARTSVKCHLYVFTVST